jgi:hypothetical protein
MSTINAADSLCCVFNSREPLDRPGQLVELCLYSLPPIGPAVEVDTERRNICVFKRGHSRVILQNLGGD